MKQLHNLVCRLVLKYQVKVAFLSHRMLGIVGTWLFIYGFTTIQALAQPVAINGSLSVSGNKIVNKNGVPVSFAGNSLFWSNDGWGGEKFYTAGVVSWLRNDWNAGIVRAAMGVEDAGGYLSNKTGNKAKVKTVVDAAIANDMYVIIDWHTHNAEANVSEAVAFFREMAQTYGNNPHVIYEIYNEPINSSWSGSIKPYAQTVINAIRAIDPDNLIIVGTRFYSAYVNEAADDPISGTNIAYTIHFYAASHHQDYIDRCSYALNKGIALFATEWGTVNADGSGNVDATWTANWMNFLKQNNISHCNWSINDKNEGASALNWGASTSGNWSSSDLTWSGSVVRDILRGYNYGTLSDAVSFNTAPIVTSSKSTYPFKLDYTAIGTKTLVLSMMDSVGTVLATATSTVTGGGTKNMSLTLSSLPSLGTKYRYKAEIKANASSTTALDTKTISNVSIVPQEPIAVIEAESYGVMSGVQKEACSEGGQNVGYLDATDWMSYSNITIPTTGKYTVYFRAAAASTVGKIRLEKDNGTTLLGAVNIPVTGGWQTWNTVSQVMDLPAGTYNMGLNVETAGYNLNFFAIAPYISKSNPTLTVTSTNAGITGNTINLTANSNSTGNLTWSMVGGNGTLSGTTLTLGAVGTVTVQASIASDANYNAASAQQVITIRPKQTPTLSISAVSKTYGDAPFSMSVTSNSNGSMTYAIVSGNSFASIHPSTGTVTILGAGTAIVSVTQSATNTFALATQTASISIAKKSLTVTADNKSRAFGSNNPTFTLSYNGFVANETSAVLDVLPTATTTASPSSSVGTYAIVATGGLDNNYAFTYVNGTLSITAITPTLSITSTNAGISGNTIALTSTSNSIGAVTWTVVSGNGTISGNTLTLGSPSSVTIQASLAATTNYTAATSQQTVSIVAPNAPTLSISSVTKTFGDAAFSMSATSNSNGAIVYSIVSGNSFASIHPTTGVVTILGAGSAIVSVSQSAASTFGAATATATITIQKASRSLSITSSAMGNVGSQINVTSVATPSNSVQYSVTNGTGSAQFNGNVLDLVSAGTVTISAFSPSDANYTSATATQRITISPVTGLLTETVTEPSISVAPNPFETQTNVLLSLPTATNVTVETFSVLGESLLTVVDKVWFSAGSHSLPISISQASVALIKVSTEGSVRIFRIIQK